jgi:hypothetical protein
VIADFEPAELPVESDAMALEGKKGVEGIMSQRPTSSSTSE